MFKLTHISNATIVTDSQCSFRWLPMPTTFLFLIPSGTSDLPPGTALLGLKCVLENLLQWESARHTLSSVCLKDSLPLFLGGIFVRTLVWLAPSVSSVQTPRLWLPHGPFEDFSFSLIFISLPVF